MTRIEAVIIEQLPSGLYRLEVDGTRRVMAHAGSGMERNFIRLIVGDRVEVELSPRDVTRGRILRKL
jgi:translation initiation factor IF-1